MITKVDIKKKQDRIALKEKKLTKSGINKELSMKTRVRNTSRSKAYVEKVIKPEISKKLREKTKKPVKATRAKPKQQIKKPIRSETTIKKEVKSIAKAKITVKPRRKAGIAPKYSGTIKPKKVDKPIKKQEIQEIHKLKSKSQVKSVNKSETKSQTNIDNKYLMLTPTVVTQPSKKTPDRWSECGQVFFTAGRAYGLTSSLRSICIGTELEIQSFFEAGKVPEALNYQQQDALDIVRKYNRGEEKAAEEAKIPATKPEGKPVKKKMGLDSPKRRTRV